MPIFKITLSDGRSERIEARGCRMERRSGIDCWVFRLRDGERVERHDAVRSWKRLAETRKRRTKT